MGQTSLAVEGGRLAVVVVLVVAAVGRRRWAGVDVVHQLEVGRAKGLNARDH